MPMARQGRCLARAILLQQSKASRSAGCHRAFREREKKVGGPIGERASYNPFCSMTTCGPGQREPLRWKAYTPWGTIVTKGQRVEPT